MCPRCGLQQLATPAGPARAGRWQPCSPCFLGNFGVHRFYLGDMAWGIGYLLFFWTGIPGFIAWIEALYFLTRSNEDWARQYGGAVESPNGFAIGCLWILAQLPFLAIGLVVFCIFLGGFSDLVINAFEV